MNLGSAVKKLRKYKNLSQEDLARVSKLSQTTISLIESGKTTPFSGTIKRIASSLDTSEYIIYLLSMEEEDVPPNKKEKFDTLFPVLETLIKQLI